MRILCFLLPLLFCGLLQAQTASAGQAANLNADTNVFTADIKTDPGTTGFSKVRYTFKLVRNGEVIETITHHVVNNAAGKQRKTIAFKTKIAAGDECYIDAEFHDPGDPPGTGHTVSTTPFVIK